MTDITIPPEALRAMMAKLPPFFSESMARAACLAMLNAWPGMEYDPGALVTDAYRDPGKIILPLPQEPRT
jgi:hypothetical protein